MTRHERLSLEISIAALVISIVSPFLNYYWFQNEVRVQQLKSEAFVVKATAYGCPDLQTIILEMRLRNTRPWPIKNVRFIIHKVVSTFDPNHQGKRLKFTLDKTGIKPEPPLAISIEEKGENIVVQFKDDLTPTPYDVVLGDLQIRNVPSGQIYSLPDMESLLPFVWASSEVSSSEVYWSFIDDCSTVKFLQRAITTR